MADAADFATEATARQLEGILASRPKVAPVSFDTECEDCGQEIAPARRQAAPHATTCIECQSIREHRARGMR
ncbi:TraR/DksA C4-type zinc finger protein [Kushneria phosphatilytica]|uniref:TraR/DksA family transcriptional regulator n=1 Tax=Kushneria phosphatilytica TaxID=657387 RepID=A0A1S1NVL6_9GAMM|nr:TraR/DksA C4-type zinc finger protein [Kushneria phosphatilytica]OHV11170.1 hypothetical protein BH688_07540 [Kushneria phosphatilytica]QEL12260.1 TraR/DksA family transcriptional regulator [Kushneria phosphatilytica]